MKTTCDLCGTEIEERYAYAAVIIPSLHRAHIRYPYGIGKAVVGHLGYVPVHHDQGYFETYEAAQEKADKLNKNMGLTQIEAYMIIMGTMRRSNP